MPLKPITLRLDEEEYEKLKKYLHEFGDPDINVAYVLRAYMRDINRALPLLVKSGWDLKNCFGLLGFWLKQFGSMTEFDMFAKMSVNPWASWKATSSPSDRGADMAENTAEGKNGKNSKEEGVKS